MRRLPGLSCKAGHGVEIHKVSRAQCKVGPSVLQPREMGGMRWDAQ